MSDYAARALAGAVVETFVAAAATGMEDRALLERLGERARELGLIDASGDGPGAGAGTPARGLRGPTDP